MNGSEEHELLEGENKEKSPIPEKWKLNDGSGNLKSPSVSQYLAPEHPDPEKLRLIEATLQAAATDTDEKLLLSDDNPLWQRVAGT